MPKRTTFLSKPLKNITLHKQDYERKLYDSTQALSAAEENLYQCRRQAQLDRKKLDDLQRDRDAWQSKHAALMLAIAQYERDMRQLEQRWKAELAPGKCGAKDSVTGCSASSERGSVEARGGEAERAEVCSTTNNASLRQASDEEKGKEEERREEGEKEVEEEEEEEEEEQNPLAIIHHKPTTRIPHHHHHHHHHQQQQPLQPSRTITTTARLATLPLVLLLSTLTRLLQRGPIYPSALDPFRRPVFMPGSLAQMLLFNIVVVTMVAEWARYKVRRCSSSSSPSSTGAMKEDLEAGEGEDENDQQQERGGKAASYAHWEFVETACGEAWRVLVVAGMAFALLVVELDYVSGV